MFKLFTDSLDDVIAGFVCAPSFGIIVVNVGCKLAPKFALFKFKFRLGGTGFGLGAVCGVLAATVGGCLNEFVLAGTSSITVCLDVFLGDIGGERDELDEDEEEEHDLSFVPPCLELFTIDSMSFILDLTLVSSDSLSCSKLVWLVSAFCLNSILVSFELSCSDLLNDL